MANKKINAYNNLYLSPIYIDEVIEALILLIKEKCGGIYHLSSSTNITYFEFAQKYYQNNKIAQKLLISVRNKNIDKLKFNSLSTYLPNNEEK